MSKANNWYETLKDDPDEIIQWCLAEIEEYKKLIKIIKKAKKNEHRKAEA